MVGLLVLAAVVGPATPARADGETWTARTAAEANPWRSVAYGNDLWVAVASNGTKQAMTSTNGINWTSQTTGSENNWQSVAYGVVTETGNGLWVAVAPCCGSGRVMTSPDGIVWTERTDGVEANNNWRSMAYGNGRWVAVASTGSLDNQVMTSTNGETWTASTSHAGVWVSVAYGDSLWVAVAAAKSADSGTNLVMTSPDGIIWTVRAAAEFNEWNSVANGNGLWVSVASSGTKRVMTSGTTLVQAQTAAPSPPSVSCVPSPLVAGASVTCTVTGGDPGIDILWRAAYNPVFAEAGVTLDGSGMGEFSFTVPAAALGQSVTVELVEWLAPVSIGIPGGPVPTSVPSGGGPVPVWSLVLLALGGGLALRRMSTVGVRA